MSHKTFRRDSYRNPSGLRSESGYGIGERTTENATSRAREAANLTPTALAAWAMVTAELDHVMPSATLRLLEPIRLLGEHDGALVVAGPPTLVALIRRRYGRQLGDTIRSLSDFRGAFVCEAEPEVQEGCL